MSATSSVSSDDLLAATEPAIPAPLPPPLELSSESDGSVVLGTDIEAAVLRLANVPTQETDPLVRFEREFDEHFGNNVVALPAPEPPALPEIDNPPIRQRAHSAPTVPRVIHLGAPICTQLDEDDPMDQNEPPMIVAEVPPDLAPLAPIRCRQGCLHIRCRGRGRGRGAGRGGGGLGVGGGLQDVDFPVDPPLDYPQAVRGRGMGRGERGGAGRGRAVRGGAGRGVAEGEPGPVVRARGGRQAGRVNYSNDELRTLMDHVERYLPVSGAEWELVARDHLAYYPPPVFGREWEHLKTKFNKMWKTRIPTGDPRCPDFIRRAKHARWRIIGKINGSTGTFDELTEYDDEQLDVEEEQYVDPEGQDVEPDGQMEVEEADEIDPEGPDIVGDGGEAEVGVAVVPVGIRIVNGVIVRPNPQGVARQPVGPQAQRLTRNDILQMHELGDISDDERDRMMRRVDRGNRGGAMDAPLQRRRRGRRDEQAMEELTNLIVGEGERDREMRAEEYERDRIDREGRLVRARNERREEQALLLEATTQQQLAQANIAREERREELRMQQQLNRELIAAMHQSMMFMVGRPMMGNVGPGMGGMNGQGIMGQMMGTPGTMPAQFATPPGLVATVAAATDQVLTTPMGRNNPTNIDLTSMDNDDDINERLGG